MCKAIVVELGEEQQEQFSQCRHHWLIEAAGGPTSKGVCRVCGAERQFRNSLDNAPWDNRESAPRDPVRSIVSSVGLTDEFEEE